MEDSLYKDAKIMVRVNQEDLGAFHEMAKSLAVPLSTLARLLLERYHASYREHGDRMVWPPRFAYYAPHVEPRDAALRGAGACAPGSGHCEEKDPVAHPLPPPSTTRGAARPTALAADAATRAPATPRHRSRRPSPQEA